MSALSNIKKILGTNTTKAIAPYWHGLKGIAASIKYGQPRQKMILVGITGTKGKTTTTMQLGRILNLSGIRTGYISTGSIYLGENTEQSRNNQQTIIELENLKLAFGATQIKSWLQTNKTDKFS